MKRASDTNPERLQRLMGYLDRDSTNLALRRDAVREALDHRCFSEAVELVRSAPPDVQSDAELQFNLGTALLALQRPADAEPVFAHLLSNDIGGQSVRYNLVFSLVAQAKFERADDLLGDARQGLLDAVPEAARLCALISYHRGRLTEGIESLRDRVRSVPGDADAWGLLSLMEYDHGESAGAKAASKRALEIDPDQSYALLTLGSIELDEGDGDDAQNAFRAVVDRDGRNGRAWSGLGFAQLLRMDLSSALGSFESAVIHMPGHIGTWHGLAWAQILSKDLDGAEASLTKALAIDRNFSETHGSMAVIAAMKGQQAEAERMARRATGLNPQSFAGRYAKTLLLQQQGRPEDAASLVSSIMSSSPMKGGQSVRVLMDEFATKNRHAKKGPGN